MTFKDHFSGHANHYARARPDYPDGLFEWLATQCKERTRAWDCATGSGQAARQLAERFEHVVATDASAAQIANAKPAANIEYRVAPAEHSRLDDASVDLVTVAQALHWFDVEKFYVEAKRVLKPSGVIAAWGYHLTRVQPEIDRIIEVFDEEIIGPFWPPERRHIDNRYQDLPFPFTHIAVPEFTMHLAWSREQFLAYIATWSAVQRYRKEKDHDPMVWLENEIAAYWNPGEVLDVSWPMFFLAGRNM
ncbi:MAG TPA: class I SAM-dependent methyltransferase [Gammaproteobacteria bacterium]